MKHDAPSQFSLFSTATETPPPARGNGAAKLKTSASKTAAKVAAPPPLAAKKRLLKIDDVCAIVGLSRATIYRLLKSPDAPFPAPVKVGAASFWVEEEVLAWLDRLIESRQATIDG